MSNVVQKLLSQVASEGMMALSVASYMEKRVEKAANLVTALTSVLSEAESVADVLLNNLPKNILVTDVDGNYKQILSEALLTAAERGEDVFIQAGSVFDVDQCVEEISSSVAGGYAAAEAFRTLAQSYMNNGDVTALISDYRSRVELRFSGLTSAAASYGYLFLDILSSRSMSIVDKIHAVLNTLGVYDTSNYSGIGKPRSGFLDITGVNVWTAFAADVLGINVVDTVINAGKKIVQGVGKVVSSVLPFLKGIHNKVKKVVKVYTAQLDSFKSDDDGEFNGFSDYGTTLKLANSTFDNPYGVDTILEATKHYGALIHAAVLGDEYYIPSHASIVDIFHEYLPSLDPFASITECVDRLYQDLAVPASISNQRTGAILHDLRLIKDYAYSRFYPDRAFFDKLSSDKYLVFETIGAEVYCWRDSSDVYIRFNWKPISVDPASFVFDDTKFISGQIDWEPMLATIKASEVKPDTDSDMIDYIEYAKRWNSLYMTYLAYAHGYTMTGNPQADADGIYSRIGTSSSYPGSYSSNDPYDNLRLARFLSGSADGECIVRDLTQLDTFTSGMLSLFKSMTSDEYYAAYYYSSAMRQGKYEVMTDSQLSNMVTYLIIGVTAVIGGFFALKAFTALRAKAFALKAKAESHAWALSLLGVGEPSDYVELYKMSRKANRLAIITGALTGSVSTLFTIGSSSSALLNSNGILNVGSNIKGGRSINDVYNLIK
jgi:hypothetical protein